MKDIYIVAIAVGGVVLLLFLICLFVIARKHRQAVEKGMELEAVYSDPKLAKMEYDIASYDDEPHASTPGEDRQVTIEDVMESGEGADEGAVFAKVDEGLEEISGKYELGK